MNTRQRRILPLLAALMIGAVMGCGGGSAPSAPPAAQSDTPPAGGSTNAEVKPGMITAADLQMGEIDPAAVEKGKTTYDVKCQACHSLGDNRIVGPGWKGITTRRKPEWIMNMVLNIDAMLSQDPEAQKMLEQCLVRMPNQNLNKQEAREVLEFMRTL